MQTEHIEIRIHLCCRRICYAVFYIYKGVQADEGYYEKNRVDEGVYENDQGCELMKLIPCKIQCKYQEEIYNLVEIVFGQ